MTRLYADKGSTYYNSARREILPLIPHSYARVLELGCGEGATLAWLKSINRCDESVGIELSEKAAVTARQVVDQVICADIERDRIEFPNEYFDLILCLDVLEHLRDPWQTLSNLTRWLKPDGTVVVSIPNVRYKSVLVDLVLRGKFEYEDSGILDKTHLRFFTRASCHSLLEGAGLSVVSVLPNPRKVGGKWGLFNALSFGYFGDIFVWQYLMAAAKIAPPRRLCAGSEGYEDSPLNGEPLVPGEESRPVEATIVRGPRTGSGGRTDDSNCRAITRID